MILLRYSVLGLGDTPLFGGGREAWRQCRRKNQGKSTIFDSSGLLGDYDNVQQLAVFCFLTITLDNEIQYSIPNCLGNMSECPD